MKKFSLIFFSVLFLYACSTTEQSSKDSSVKETYIFDDTSYETKENVKEEKVVESPKVEKSIFFVQLAAFTSEDRADIFIAENKSKLNYPLVKKYSEKVKLFVVQLPPFSTREEAESVRNSLWKIDAFKDAFITQ
jgi:cell division septation protein DedD